MKRHWKAWAFAGAWLLLLAICIEMRLRVALIFMPVLAIVGVLFLFLVTVRNWPKAEDKTENKQTEQTNESN